MKDGGYDLGLLAGLEEVCKMLTNESTFEADERVEKIKENVEVAVPAHASECISSSSVS